MCCLSYFHAHMRTPHPPMHLGMGTRVLSRKFVGGGGGGGGVDFEHCGPHGFAGAGG